MPCRLQRLPSARRVETVQCVCLVAFYEVLYLVKRQVARRLVINPTNVLRLVNMKIRSILLSEDGIGVEYESFACFLVSIIVNKYYHRLETDTGVTLTHNYDASDNNDEHLTASGSYTVSSIRGVGSSESVFQQSPGKKCKVQSVITVFDDHTLENIPGYMMIITSEVPTHKTSF